MDPHVAGGLFSALGAFVGAGVALLGGWLARKHERERTDAAWSREKVLEAYSGCLYFSVLLGVRATEHSAKEDPEVGQQYAEAQRHLLLLRAYSGDAEVRTRLARHSEQLQAAWDKRTELSEAADDLAEEVGNLLAADRRVNLPMGDIRPARPVAPSA